MGACLSRWLLPAVFLLSAAALARGAAPPAPERTAKPWTGVIEAHHDCTEGAALSADGNTLVTTAGTRMAASDLRTGKVVCRRWFNGRKLYQAALVSGGKEVACVVDKEEVHLLELATLKTRAVIDTEPRKYGRNRALAASSDGGRLAVATHRTVVVWEAAAPKLVWREALSKRRGFSIDRVAFSHDGKVLAVAVDDEEPLRLLDAATGRELRRLAVADKRIRLESTGGLAYTPDGRSLVYAYRHEVTHVRDESTHRLGAIRVWDASIDRLTASLTWQRKGERSQQGSDSLAVSPDGKTLAADESDGRLQLFEVATGGLRHRVSPGDRDRVCARAAFCPDGRLVRPDTPKGGHIDVSDWRRAAAKPGRLTDEEAPRLWEGLGSKDAEVGFRAVARLLVAPERQALALLAQVRRVEPLTDKQIARLIADLDDDDLDVRERATDDLKRAGPRAEKALRAALAKPPSIEVKKRAITILANLTPLRPERLRFLRAVEALEAISSHDAQKHLERLAGGAAGVEETEDAKAALTRLRQRSKQ